jgi:hypothetical protein
LLLLSPPLGSAWFPPLRDSPLHFGCSFSPFVWIGAPNSDDFREL